jgi:hypothetical protein
LLLKVTTSVKVPPTSMATRAFSLIISPFHGFYPVLPQISRGL